GRRHDHGADPDRREVGDERRWDGGSPEEDPVLLTDAERAKRRAEPAHRSLELTVSDPLVLVEDRDAVSVPGLDVAVDQLLGRVETRRVALMFRQAIDPLGPEGRGRQEARGDRTHRHLSLAVLGAGAPGSRLPPANSCA